MKSRWVGLALTILVLLMICLAPGAAKAARSQSNPCSVVFADRPLNPTDLIHSDNGGSYADTALGGDKTVSCQVGGSSNDSIKLLLSFPPKPSGPRRTFWVYATDPVGGGSTGTFYDGSYFIIEHVAGMSAGTSQTADVHFRFNNGNWFFNWCGLAQGNCVNYPGSNVAWVTRDAIDGHWDVSTDSPGGDVAQLQVGTSGSDFYHVPFKLQIYCPACPKS